MKRNLSLCSVLRVVYWCVNMLKTSATPCCCIIALTFYWLFVSTYFVFDFIEHSRNCDRKTTGFGTRTPKPLVLLVHALNLQKPLNPLYWSQESVYECLSLVQRPLRSHRLVPSKRQQKTLLYFILLFFTSTSHSGSSVKCDQNTVSM